MGIKLRMNNNNCNQSNASNGAGGISINLAIVGSKGCGKSGKVIPCA